MPEIVTKYPDVMIKILKDAHGKCAEGKTPQILKTCPPDQFCALPTGEICVYGLNNISAMTQVNSAEWVETVTQIPGIFSLYNLLILIMVFGLGLIVGAILRKK